MRRVFMAVLLASLGPMAAAQVRPLTLTQLCDGSTRIVVGGVTKMTPRWEGNRIVTDVTVQTAEHLKGTGSQQAIVTIPGGTIGSVTLKVSEAPTFAVGELCVIFVRPTPACGVYGWFRGKYTVLPNQEIRELPNTTYTQFRADILAQVNR